MSKEFRLGLFIVFSLVLFSVAIFWIGGNELRFKPHYNVKAQFDNVTGLYEGANVRVGGIHAGEVKNIELPKHPDGKVVVTMQMESSTRDLVKRDSVAAIKSEGLLGDKYVEVSFGSEGSERIKGGETIGSEAPLDIADLIVKTNAILDSTKGAVDNIEQTAANMTEISNKINHGQGTVGALINDKTIYQQAAAGTTALNEDMEALKHNFLTRGFFRSRGYEDAAELKKHEIAKLPAESPVKAFSYEAKKVFDQPDKAKLKNTKMFNEAGKFLEAQPFGLAVVAAYTDTKGDTDKDRQLTEARAMVVRNYLVQNFRMDDTKVKTIGLGKATNADEGVEVLVYPAGVKPAAAQAQGSGTRE